MKCALCQKCFPDELVKPLEMKFGWHMVCAICAAAHGGVQGLNYRRAVHWLAGEQKRMQDAFMRAVALDPDPKVQA